VNPDRRTRAGAWSRGSDSRVVGCLTRAVVLGIWCTGWYLALQSAQLNLILEPTDKAVRAAADSVPSGLAGCVVCAVAAVCGAVLARSLIWLLLTVPAGVVAVMLVREPGSGGWAFMGWLLGTVATAGVSGALALVRVVTRRNACACRESHPRF
jgi:hypothetical protein